MRLSKEEVGSLTQAVANNSLSDDDRIRIKELLAAQLGTPSSYAADHIWLIVAGAFALALLGTVAGLIISVFKGETKASPELLLSLATAIIGFFGGLFARPPGSTKP